MWVALCDSVFDTYRFLSLSVSMDLMHPIASKSLLVMTVIFALYSPNLICTISSALQSVSLLSLLLSRGVEVFTFPLSSIGFYLAPLFG